jgi:hypothetical protein
MEHHLEKRCKCNSRLNIEFSAYFCYLGFLKVSCDKCGESICVLQDELVNSHKWYEACFKNTKIKMEEMRKRDLLCTCLQMPPVVEDDFSIYTYEASAPWTQGNEDREDTEMSYHDYSTEVMSTASSCSF